MIIESGHDLRLLVQAYFLDQHSAIGSTRPERLLPGLTRVGPLVAVVLDAELRCQVVQEVDSRFEADFGPAMRRILDAVLENRGRYVAVAHLGDARRAELDRDAMPWSLSLQRLRLELAQAGAMLLRHVVYDDGIYLGGWHDVAEYGADVPEVRVVHDPSAIDGFTERLEQECADAEERIRAVRERQRSLRMPYVPPPAASDEGTLLTTALSETEFRALTWKVRPLSQFLRDNGLKAHGRKDELIERVAALLAGRDTSEWLDARVRRRPVFADEEAIF